MVEWQRQPRATADLAMPRIGELLRATGKVPPGAIEAALASQARCGCRLGEILSARGQIDERTLVGVLSRQSGIPVLDPRAVPASAELARSELADLYCRSLLMPWTIANRRTVYAAVDPRAAERALAASDPSGTFVLIAKRDLVEALDERFGAGFAAAASRALALMEPAYSAGTGLVPEQKAVICGGCAALALAVLVAPLQTIGLIGVAAAAGFWSGLALRLAVAAIGLGGFARPATAGPPERSLPVYTILVPLYREARAVGGLIAALRALDYPPAKLDIKLIVELDDAETRTAIAAAAPPPIFEVVTVPPTGPRTKPKACNYALHFARGQYVVIYDAEDRPEPGQLREALAAFAAGGAALGCAQARLRFYNARESWLTAQSALEYLFWFNLMLPGLRRLGLPIPLGGTSNHFPLAVLRRLHAWDPHNVTEDADLGLRLAREGYRTEILQSVTYEEAIVDFSPWLRQRTRWLKGYLQTYAVHMRQPGQLCARLGLRGFLGFQFTIGGTVAAALLHPLWIVGLLDWACRGGRLGPVAIICGALLAAGNLMAIGTGIFVALHRGGRGLLGAALTIPVYWLLQSIAGYRALWHLAHAPFHWEKTTHGVSRVAWRIAPTPGIEAPIGAPAAPRAGIAARLRRPGIGLRPRRWAASQPRADL
jgi:glycosyltransferase involved in cell wall biosynthesis